MMMTMTHIMMMMIIIMLMMCRRWVDPGGGAATRDEVSTFFQQKTFTFLATCFKFDVCMSER